MEYSETKICININCTTFMNHKKCNIVFEVQEAYFHIKSLFVFVIVYISICHTPKVERTPRGHRFLLVWQKTLYKLCFQYSFTILSFLKLTKTLLYYKAVAACPTSSHILSMNSMVGIHYWEEHRAVISYCDSMVSRELIWCAAIGCSKGSQ